MSVNLSKGDFNLRPNSKSNITEIQNLQTSINILAEKLEQQDLLRKRLVSDISHEIRTPLNVLQNNLEAIIDGVYPVTTYCNKLYIDASIQGYKQKNEYRALTDMVECSNMRCGIETSFRELKYSLGLINFHSKNVEYIIQEIFAKLVMHNFCEIITLHVVIKQKSTKHTYQVNFTMAMQICTHFFMCPENITPPDIEALIRKYILPIRDGRKDQRKLKSKTTISFNYRVA